AGEINSGIITLMGSALLTITSAAGGSGLNNGINGLGLANNNNTLGVFNLNGGTLTTPHIMKRTGQTGNIGVFNFNGGTLRPNGTASLSTFIQNLDGAYIYGGGAFIDDTGATLTIPQPLLNPTGSGVSAITLSGGSGFLAPPVISIGGGGGFGATAVANIDAGGNLTSVTITNPGVGYTSAPTLTLFGGAGEPTSTSYTVTLATNSGGGLTKLGAGTVILTGNNTYMGPTSIQSGKLVLGNGGTTGSLGIGNIVNSGELGFNRTDALTVLGNISGIGGLSQAGTGTTTLAGIYGATGAIKVTAGTLAFAETTAARRTANVLITTNALSITNNGSVMDIGNRDVMITNQTPASSNTIINTYWKNGTALLLGAGDPSGPQITSSTVNNNTSSFPTFIVAFDIDAVFGGGVTGDGSGAGSSLGAYTDNQVVTQPGTIMVKYGYYTDIDFSGKVDAGDINLVLGALGSTSPGLSNPGLSYLLGDVDYSGKVDAGDINLVLGMLGAGSGGANGNPLGVSSVPEPASAALLACGGLLLLGRRRREVRRRAGEGIAER
ncbi:MAG TPA: autotransporter-associated beta strand repeat-containing protein, partial [Phycisphaerae bacterium]|nr:autotransporter-associated beta strand repeat-containing protein [Phycisphaerae bacterium]